jgi:hypothetical protein
VRTGDRLRNALDETRYIAFETEADSDAITTAVPFGGQISSGSAVRFPVKKSRLLFIAIFDVFSL